MIGVPFGVQHLSKRRLRHTVRPVLIALTPLVLDDVALRVDRLRRHRIEQVAHPVGLEKQRELERVRWHVDPVIRSIVLGRSIVGAAGAFKPLVEFARLHVARAHEHQVLEEMREARTPGAFARRANVVPHIDGDDGHAVILVKDYVKAVGQRELCVLNLNLEGRNRAVVRSRLRLCKNGHGEPDNEQECSGSHNAILLRPCS